MSGSGRVESFLIFRLFNDSEDDICIFDTQRLLFPPSADDEEKMQSAVSKHLSLKFLGTSNVREIFDMQASPVHVLSEGSESLCPEQVSQHVSRCIDLSLLVKIRKSNWKITTI